MNKMYNYKGKEIVNVVKIQDVINAIESLPNYKNGWHSDLYDKNMIFSHLMNLQKYEVLKSELSESYE